MTTSPYATSSDPRSALCYGEIYTFEGRFWAEIILEEDGLTTVTAQSVEFAKREDAASWLADHGLFFPPSLLERVQAFLSSLVRLVNLQRAPRLARSAG
jgi:hypothetical protein